MSDTPKQFLHKSFFSRLVALFHRWSGKSRYVYLHGSHYRPSLRPQVFTSPSGGAKEATLAVIKRARESILVCMYVITDPDYTEALISKHQSGVSIRIGIDRRASENAVQCAALKQAGIHVRKCPWKCFHHKFMVVDKRIVVLGSMNWTRSGGNKNGDSILVVRSRRLARQLSAIIHFPEE